MSDEKKDEAMEPQMEDMTPMEPMMDSMSTDPMATDDKSDKESDETELPD